MIGTIIIFLLIFFVIVMGHEFGHFLIAKVNGIRVNEFAIGMGPKITGFKKGETEYVLRAFPLGGACIFEGEDGLEAAKEEASAAGTPADKTGRGALQNVPVDVDRGNFQNAPVWSRIATVFAGPLFNFFTGIYFRNYGCGLRRCRSAGAWQRSGGFCSGGSRNAGGRQNPAV